MNYKEFLASKIKPFEYQKRFGRMYVLHPLHVGTFVFAIALQATGMVAHELRDWSHWANIGWVSARHTIFLTVLFFVEPYLIRFFALNRIPYVWVFMFHYIAYIVIYMSLFGAYVSQFTHVPTVVRAANNILFGLPFIIALAGVFGRRAAYSVFDDPTLYPTWRRFKFRKNAFIDQFPADNQNTIRFVRSTTPSSEIATPHNVAVVSMPFKQVVDQLPEEMGWRVHRSYWVAKSEISTLRYVDGNPNIEMRGGEVIPISRKFVPHIKEYLALQEAKSIALDVE